MNDEFIGVKGIDITPKGIKIAYIDREGEKTLFTPEPARPEFYDAGIQLSKEALLLPNFGALNKKEIKETGELANIIKIAVEKLSFSTVKDVGAVVTLRIFLWLNEGMGVTIALDKIPYIPGGESSFAKAIMKYEEEAEKYVKGERAQENLFEDQKDSQNKEEE